MKNLKKKYILFTFVAILYSISSLLSSCGEPPPMRLTSRERMRIDTLYKKQVRNLGPEMDSICNLHFDQRVAEAVDSIIKVRKEEEVRLRARILGNEKN